ncbi:unnamed protein product [Spirodela intermedia]|uniref:Uncharacterized protein n=1 Tax=Spirodela intermedia TaxID=51605 RepID=A0A7I8KNU8_SPIIN|nr:unnamed protein product [Spirodela intermedia]
MASKLLLLLLVFSLGLAGVRADSGIVDEGVDPQVPEDPSPLRRELEKLKSKIASLEFSVAEGEKQLKVKDESILLFEKIIKEKTHSVASLQDQIESLQGAADAAQLLGKAHARTAELEKQLEDLRSDTHAQNEKQGALATRAIEAERKVEELNLKLENLQSANDEQKKRIKKIERALKVAEEELMKVRLEASSKKKELNEIHGAWLPPWLADHVVHYRAKAAAHWSNHGKPAYDIFVQKVLEVSSQAKKKIGPHVETAKTKWIPILKERWVIVRTSVEPYARSAATRTVELYETSLKPHLLKAQEAADPYLQDVKKFSKPYIDQVATITRPHVEKTRIFLKPYTKKAARVYRKFLRSATTYHRQIQTVVKDTLLRHELTRALATEELVWFAASASLVLPIFVAFQLLAPIFRKKPRRRVPSPPANQTHRRPKRSRHADK